MKRFLSLVFVVLTGSALWAQDEGQLPAEIAEPVVPAVSRVVNVDETVFANLPAKLPRAGAVSLRVSGEAFEANANARDALASWVAAGNAVFLHTGAAEFFGFQTVEAREGSNERGGQLFGRARAALPFGSHPMLWDDGRTLRRADPTRLPGVNVVFYELQPGDHLVTGSITGTPLLEVTDLAASRPSQTPLFAAAIAPYGRGWAIFCPDSVDQRRADGALFARNLLSFAPGARPSLWVSLSSDALQGGADAVRGALQNNLNGANDAGAPALPNLGDAAPAVAAPPVEIPIAGKAPALAVGRAEAGALLAALNNGGLALLRARYALQSGDFASANQNLQTLEANDALAGETAFLSGCVNAASANDVTAPSPVRAEAAQNAARDFNAAATLTPLVGATPGAIPNASSSARRRDWSAFFNRLSAIFAAEPPLAQTFGTGDSTITLRFFADDPTLTLLQPAAQTIAATGAFGWRTSRQEVLLFPSPAAYANYRRGSGLTTQNVPLPAASVGDVVGQRIIMASVPTTPFVFRDPRTGIARLVPRTAGATIFSRLQAYALLNAWLDGSGRVPAWLALGLENLAAQTLDGAAATTLDGDTLQRFAAAGGLLLPNQFGNGNTEVARAQSAALVAYFYREFGAGAVTETVQRLGAGQTSDDALLETTESDEAALFTTWRNVQFGPQRFPNAG